MFLVEPGEFTILLIVVAHALTGLRVESFDVCKLTVPNLSPFFWSSKVMDTMSVDSKSNSK